jgi:hypothetical protein
MFERELTLYAFNQHYLHKLTADLTDEHLAQPTAGVNPPVWLLGHLCVGTDFALMLLGGRRKALCPPDWHRDFSPGSPAIPERRPLPTKAELLTAYDRGHAAVAEAVRTATPEQLDKPHGVDMPQLKTHVPTVGDLIAHLLTTHEATHLGQLSAWRRQAGLPGVF